MKILLASWAPFHAGAEIAAGRLAIGLVEQGHEVLIVLGTQGETSDRMRELDLRCEVVPLTLTNKWRFWQYADARRQMVKLLQREQPDVVHCNDLPTNQMVGQAVQRLEIPCVCHHRFPFGGTALNWMNKFPAQRHVFVSRYLMNEICAASSKIAAAPCEVVYDGLPLPQAPSAPDRQAAREKLNLPLDKVLVLFAGQMVERKGVADLIHAWQLLPEAKRNRAELLMVGDDLQNAGAYRIQMEHLAQQTGCPARFFGFQRNLPEWLSAADLAVVPSHVEPLGNATLEAMAHALPVVGGNVGGIPEMIVEGETGLLVPAKTPLALAAAIERLIDNVELRHRMGAAARQRCEALFSLPTHVRNMVEQYELALESKACLSA